MNLADIGKQDLYDSILSDCISPGFMGMTRMIIFRDLILKTDKEIANIQEEESLKLDDNQAETLEKRPKTFDDVLWIETLQNAPETNFFVFIGNKTSVTELEKWIALNGTVHDFSVPSSDEIQASIISSL
jgi:hypothetical protein